MRVLIVGGGIGGLALAAFLRDAGIDHLLIERAPSFRALGHFIALKADGVRVLDRLGIREACAARALPASIVVSYRTAAGRSLRRQPSSQMDAALGGFLMLRRGDLAEVLYRRIEGSTELRFGTEITALAQDASGVSVTLSDGHTERFDAVVGADGVHSALRKRVFGSSGEEWLGGSYIALEVAASHGLAPGDIVAFLGRGKVVATVPLDGNRLAAVVYHGGDDLRAQLANAAEARAFFARHYAEFHPDVRAFFSAIDASSFVFVDTITMVRLPSIVANRVTLVGDAAACPTFLSGMGSAYAMLSAERLARELERENTEAGSLRIPAALAAYARGAEAHARETQASALRMRYLVLGQSPALTTVRNSVIALAPTGWLMGHVKRFYSAQHEGSMRTPAPRL